MKVALVVLAILAVCLPGTWAVAGERAPSASPFDDGRVSPRDSAAMDAQRGGSRGGITIDVFASSAPNASGSASWSGYVVNALYALEHNLAVNGNRQTDPAGYERAPAVIPPGEIAVTSFHSWRGVVNPPAPFANELGNRMHFGLHAYGDGTAQFTLENLTFELHSDDPWDSLLYAGDFIGFSYSSTRYGIDWGADRTKGGGDDTTYTSGNGATLVDEIVYVGVGNAWWPSGSTPQADMDDYFAWIASDGPINVTCTYAILGDTGSDSVLVEQQTVDSLGSNGWLSDDTRGSTGTDLVGVNYTHYGKPGQPPTTTDDAAIANQIQFVRGPEDATALKLTKTSVAGGYSKSTISTVDEDGFAIDDWRAGFFANYRYYAESTAEVAVLKIGIQSPLWGTGAGQSQNGFTALRSGEAAWDLVLVDWRGSQPPWTVNAWDTLNTDADTQCWYVYKQGNNAFFNGPLPQTPKYSLNQLYAMNDPDNPAHVARADGATKYTWSEMLFGSGAKVTSIQFGVGSSTQTSTTYIDYLDTSLLNGGNRVDFYGPSPVTLGVYPSLVPDEQEPRINLGDAPASFEPDSWQNSATGKVNWHARYLADGDSLTALFPSQAATLTINDLDSIRYWTKRPDGTAAGRDWAIYIYTRPKVGGDGSWYGYRFLNNYEEHTAIGAWTQYSTASDMTFRKNSGTETGLMSFDDLKAVYGTELIEMISVQTMSNWSGAFDGYMDGLTITLTDGTVGQVNFVRQPTLTLVADDECYAVGDIVTVAVWMNDVPESIVGGQFFLQYNQSALDFDIAAPGEDPFDQVLYEVVDETTGTIDYSVTADYGDPGAAGTKRMAVLKFVATAPICSATNLITFRANDPPTRLSDAHGNAVYPDLIDLDVMDTEAPVITCPASITVECSASTTPAATGSATAADNCDPTPILTYDDVTNLTDCDGTGTITRTWTATDACGNANQCTQAITVVDTTAPVITSCPGPIFVNADAGTCEAVVDPGTATATDNCDTNVAVVGVRSDGLALTDPYPASVTTTITWTATDDCGNTDTCTQAVTVTGFNDLVVTVELSPTMAASVERCITFELWNCTTLEKETVSEVLEFTNGQASDATIMVPCTKGPFECITARDALHTLRSTTVLTDAGTQYTAAFTGNGMLIGGNFNDDKWIDILDFGVFSWQWGQNYGSGNTTCDTAYPHADASGNGVVWTEDFLFVQGNFLKSRQDNCCGQSGFRDDESAPVTRVSVDDLYAQGLGELAAGDYTGDGWLDEDDMAAFASGTGPAVQIGDLNCDGVVSFGDINPFVQAVTSPAAWAETYPGCNTLNGDVNEDGVVNLADINPFIALLQQ